MVSQLHTPRWTTDQIARAAGIPAGTLSAQLRRGELAPWAPLGPVEMQHPGTGRTRYFSLIAALHVALTAELCRHGFTVPKASAAAQAFTDHTSLDVEKAVLLEDHLPDPREPGNVFPDSAGTLLRVLYSSASEPVVEVVRLEDFQTAPLANHTGEFRSALIISLDALRTHVLAVLGATA